MRLVLLRPVFGYQKVVCIEYSGKDVLLQDFAKILENTASLCFEYKKFEEDLINSEMSYEEFHEMIEQFTEKIKGDRYADVYSFLFLNHLFYLTEFCNFTGDSYSLTLPEILTIDEYFEKYCINK